MYAWPRIRTVSASATDDKFVHLTNNAVQKHADTYGQLEQGNQRSLDELRAEMQRQGLPDFDSVVLPEMKRMTLNAVQATRRSLNMRGHRYCFEILGLDFMIDGGGRPWLIEVNSNPSLSINSAVLRRVIPAMIHDAMRLTVDTVFPVSKRVRAQWEPNGFVLLLPAGGERFTEREV